MEENADTLTEHADSESVTTHISLLVLTGDRVMKFRKPIATDFCDFTTIQSRLHDCEREVELNRRLTDDVYLGVGRVQLTGQDEGDAEPCVVMRRLPADRLLSALVKSGKSIDGEVRAIAAQLATFHESAERVTATNPTDGPRAVRARWADAIEQLRGHARDRVARAALDEIEQLSSRWLEGRSLLFFTRSNDGFVRDGHGDLRAENIFCLDDGPRILDCIEFDDELRRIDVATDLAFLVMDLRRLGRSADAETLITEYERTAGAVVPRGLVDHDAAYWALVRAKVTHLRAAQGDRAAATDAAELEAFALEQLRQARIRLIVIGGLPGTGKSTVARDLASVTGWAVVSSDHVRKELAALPETARTGDGYGAGLYHPDRVAAVYTEMLGRARRLLEQGRSVILDASWSRLSDRADAASLALVTDAVLHEVECVVDDEVARHRLTERAAQNDDASDAGPAIAKQMASTYEPWPSALEVDTEGVIGETTSRLRQSISLTETT